MMGSARFGARLAKSFDRRGPLHAIVKSFFAPNPSNGCVPLAEGRAIMATGGRSDDRTQVHAVGFRV